MSELPVVKVSALNRYMARLVGAQSALSHMRVEGELANVKLYRSGHLYFSLRDEQATVSCVMFKNSAAHLPFKPADGMKVVTDCHAGFYERSGTFQLYVASMQQAGLGNLFEAFNALKQKLGAEGLLDAARKRPLPRFPCKIGVVTSQSGAVIRDIIHVLSRRWPGFELLLYPCQVQGPGAADSIAAGIRTLNRLGGCDVLIVGRGGGSMEDLWAFNDEGLARTIAESAIPVISAVGHETDFTIADFVADMRAPTPSAAAELAVPVKSELRARIAAHQAALRQRLIQELRYHQMRLQQLKLSPSLMYPNRLIETRRQALDRLGERLSQALEQLAVARRRRLAEQCIRLDALSPLRVLARGYGMVTDETGRPVTTVSALATGDPIGVVLADGRLSCTVEAVRSEAPSAWMEEQTT